MAKHPERAHHPIRGLHGLACLGLACGFLAYAWQHHPVRRAWRAHPRPAVVRTRPGGLPDFAGALAWRLDLIRTVLPDALGGLGVLLLFSLGTGVYARRLEVWLEAHQAGEAAAIRGVGLDRAALGANKDRRKGAAS